MIHFWERRGREEGREINSLYPEKEEEEGKKKFLSLLPLSLSLLPSPFLSSAFFFFFQDLIKVLSLFLRSAGQFFSPALIGEAKMVIP